MILSIIRLSIFNNIFNKFKRGQKQRAFSKKTARQNSSRIESDFELRHKNNKIFKLIPSFLFNPKYILIPLFIVVILISGLHIYRIIDAWVRFAPKAYFQDDLQQSRKWTGKDKVTILLVGTDKKDEDHVFIDALGIYSIDPLSNSAAVFMINPDLRVYMPAIGKNVNFRTILHDKDIKTDKLIVLKNAVSTLLAVKVDKYILVDKSEIGGITSVLNPIKVNVTQSIKDSDTIALTDGKLLSWNQGAEQLVWGSELLAFVASDDNGRDDQLQRQQNVLVTLPYFQNSIRTFINLPEILKSLDGTIFTDIDKEEFLYIISSVFNIKEKDIKKGYTRAESYSKVDSISFYPVFAPDLSQIDKDINNIFFDLKIFKEQAKVEVLNSSNVRGLANNRARWIVNVGARVVKIGNGFEPASVTKIYCAEPERYPDTLAELQRIFNGKAELVASKFPNRHVGDIVIELGDIYE